MDVTTLTNYLLFQKKVINLETNYKTIFKSKMNKKLNVWYFIISIIVLLVILILDKLFNVEIDINLYLIIIPSSIVALGNCIVIRLQRSNCELASKSKRSQKD